MKVLKKKCKILWTCTYWVLPKYWVGIYNNKDVCGISYEYDHVKNISQYKVYEITKSALKELEDNRQFFNKNVGYHLEYDPKVYKPYVNRGREMTAGYYDDLKRKKVDFSSPPPKSKLLGSIAGPDIEWYFTPGIAKGGSKAGGRRNKK